MPAPKGYWKFMTNCIVTAGIAEHEIVKMSPLFPNPASAITCIPLSSQYSANVKVELKNVLGQTMETIFEGEMTPGEKNVFFNAANYSAGVYVVCITTNGSTKTQKVIIQ